MWQPIETAPKDNKRPLWLARFNDDGTMQSFDYNGSWESESESWEMPQVYYFWATENGYVEEPSHWAYQLEEFDTLPGAKGEEKMSTEFRRETRYVVLKNADIMQCLTINELIELRRIQARVAEHRTAIGKPRLECVVVEKDWPEYEPTWKAIEMRMTGSLKESAVQTAARVMNIELIRERDDLRAENDELRNLLEAMEKQEPVASVWRCDNGHIHGSCERTLPMGTKLYALPGAKGED